MTAILEELIRVGFLKIGAADFTTGNMGCDRQHRYAAAMAIIETVDQMHVARSTTSGADRQFARQMRLRPGSKGSGFLMAHGNPFDVLAFADLLQDAVKRISHNSVNTFDSGRDQGFDENCRDAFL